MAALWHLLISVSVSLSPGDPSTLASHVRAASPRAQTLLAEAVSHSAVINRMIEHLESTDTIVYVDVIATPEIPLARTKLVSGSAVARFLRVSINARVATWDRVPLLAHELQHAIEIADAADVRDDDGVRRLYMKIGFGGGADRFETAAARETEWKVRTELARLRK